MTDITISSADLYDGGWVPFTFSATGPRHPSHPVRLNDPVGSMRECFDDVVNQDMPPNMDLINYSIQIFDLVAGIRSLADNEIDGLSTRQFTQQVRPTGHTHHDRHYTFLINVATRPRVNAVRPLVDGVQH